MILQTKSFQLQAAPFVSKPTRSEGFNLLVARDNVFNDWCEFFAFSISVASVHGPANSCIRGSFSLEEVVSKC